MLRSSPDRSPRIRRRAPLAVILVVASLAMFTVPMARPAAAVENTQWTGWTQTTVNDSWQSLWSPQVGDVRTRHWADTVIQYPRRVRAGQHFQYTRCVVRLHLEEPTGYETSTESYILDGTWYGVGGEQYTQGYRYLDVWACRTYDATAPGAGATGMGVPAATVTQYGGVGYAGSCCPTWGLYWNSYTQDNWLSFDAVYTPPLARNDGPFTTQRNGSTTVQPFVNDDGLTGGLGAVRGSPTARAITVQATKGTCAWNGDSIIYTNTGGTGTDSCTYQVNQDETDGQWPSNGATSATISFSVNSPPVANPDGTTTTEDAPITVDVVANDTDPELAPLTVQSATVTTGAGTATIDANQVRFDPGTAFQHLAANGSAAATVEYVIVDPSGGTATSQLTVTVTGLYDLPTAVDDTMHVDENGPAVTVDPRGNDQIDDGDPYWVRALDTADLVGVASFTGTSVTVGADGRWEHLALGQTALTSFGYAASDDPNPTALTAATITVTVHGGNDVPTANDDTATVNENATVTIAVAANDTDPDTIDVLGATSAWLVAGAGSVSVSSGSVVYSAALGFEDLAVGESRPVVVGYTVSDPHGATSNAEITVTVNGTNDDPTPSANDLTVSEDGPTGTVEVIGGLVPDTDPDTSDIDDLAVASVTDPARGTASHGATTVSYDPAGELDELADGDTATMTFSYTAVDPHGGSASATVTVLVVGANDAPTATPDVLDLDEADGAASIDVLANDLDVDHGSNFSLRSISAGTFADFPHLPTITGSTVTFDPAGGFTTLSQGETAVLVVTYEIVDEHDAITEGTLEVRVHGANEAPVGSTVTRTIDENTVLVASDLAAGATDVDRADTLAVVAVDATGTAGALSLAGGVVSYDPTTAFHSLDAGQTGTDQFAVTVDDGHGATTVVTTVVTVAVTVLGRNDDPATVDDTATTDEDTVITVDVVGNDGDAESGELRLTGLDTSVTQSSVRIVGATIEVDPRAAFNNLDAGAQATDVVTYTVTDPRGALATGVLTITIDGRNDAPDGATLTLTVPEDASGSLDLREPGADPDANAVVDARLLRSGPSQGVASLDGDVVRYETAGRFGHLAQGETAEDRMLVDVADEHDATGTATIAVVVQGTNDAPTARPDSFDAVDWRSPTIAVLANDTDPDTTNRLRLTDVDGAGVGRLRIDGDLIRWDLGETFAGLDPGQRVVQRFTYTVTDDAGATATSTGTMSLVRTVTNDVDDDGDGIPDWFEKDRETESRVLAERAQRGPGTGDGTTASAAASVRLPDEPTTCPVPNEKLSVARTARAGAASITVEGTQPWLAHSRVTYYICSDPQLVATVDAGADGLAAGTLRLPRGLHDGAHTLLGIGLGPDGQPLVQANSIEFVGGIPAQLAFTGTESRSTGGIGVALVAVGLVCLWFTRRVDGSGPRTAPVRVRSSRHRRG